MRRSVDHEVVVVWVGSFADDDEVVGDDKDVAKNADNDAGRRGDVVVDDEALSTTTRR